MRRVAPLVAAFLRMSLTIPMMELYRWLRALRNLI